MVLLTIITPNIRGDVITKWAVIEVIFGIGLDI
jgi:hypothetical protein